MSSQIKMPSRIKQIKIDEILPGRYQPRHDFDEAELHGLSESIAQNGILQPISIRRTDDGLYEVIAGERRLRAARMAGHTKVPCIELSTGDEVTAVLSLIENMQRQNLNFFEEAEAIARLMEEWEITQEAAATKLGKSQSALANKLRLLRLTPNQRKKILESGLTERHARTLLRIMDWQDRDKALAVIIERHYNVSDTETYIDRLIGHTNIPRGQTTTIIKDVRLFFNTVTKALDTMRRSGIKAEAAKAETEDYIEYTVRIPKASTPVCRLA